MKLFVVWKSDDIYSSTLRGIFNTEETANAAIKTIIIQDLYDDLLDEVGKHVDSESISKINEEVLGYEITKEDLDEFRIESFDLNKIESLY